MKSLVFGVFCAFLLVNLVSCGGGGGGGGSNDFTPASGTLAASFGGGDGFVVHYNAAGGDLDDSGEAIALDNAGKIYVVGSSQNDSANNNFDMVVWRFASDGTLDLTFGGEYDINPGPDGFTVLDSSSGGDFNDFGNDIVVAGNGKIYVTGSSEGDGNDMTIWRLNANGSLDTTFGSGDGYVTHDGAAGLVGSDDVGRAIALDSDDHIYVVGESNNGGYDVVLWRYNLDGTRDLTFGGGDGFVLFDNSTSGDDYAYDMAIGSDNKIYVVGESSYSSDRDMVLWRFNSNGTLDTFFGGDLEPDGFFDGFVVHGGAAGGDGPDLGQSLVIDENGLIYVAGHSLNVGGDYDTVLWRFTDNGILDTTFGGGDGYVVHDNAAGGSGHDYGYHVAIDDGGNVYVVGSSTDSALDMVLWRFTNNGVLDTTFGAGTGFVIHNSAAGASGDDEGLSLLLDQDGRICIAGYGFNTSGNTDMVLWKYE